MATSYEEIKGFLENRELKFKHVDQDDNEFLLLGSGTSTYVDDEGDNHVRIIIELHEDGEFIRFIAPNLYQYDGPYKAQVFQLCVMSMYTTKMIQYEYDPSDGEIRMTIEWPIEDGNLTEKQMMRALAAIVEFADKHHIAFKTAMDSGEIKLDDDREKMRAMMELMSSAQGMSAADLLAMKEALEEKKKAGGAPSVL